MAGFPYYATGIQATPVGAPIVMGDTVTGLLVPLKGNAHDGIAVWDRIGSRQMDELIANVKQLCHLLIWAQGPPGLPPPVVVGACLDNPPDGQVT